MKTFLKNNISIIAYFIIAIILDTLTNIIMFKNPLILSPWFGITLLSLITCLLVFIRKGIIRYYIACSLLFVQGVINLFCIILFDMTGTLFDFGMLNLRNDAMGILENIPMNFTYLYIFGILLVGYATFIIDFAKKEHHISFKYKNIVTGGIAFSLLAANIICIFNINNVDRYYSDRLYQENNTYQMYGATSNFINQFYKGLFFNRLESKSSEQIDNFIYKNVSTPTEYFGISKGNNLVTILAESLEWTAFIQDIESYPNGLHGLTQEDINYLLPNITKFYTDSVKMVNSYSREKTDISENLSIIGSYPTDVYINYDYPNNTSPFTIPAIFEANYENLVSGSFHNGYKTYYNRNEAIPSLGFDYFYGMEDMLKISDTFEEPTMFDHNHTGERNLDSEMIQTMKDIMFPTDKQFYTYITTFTMHGMYYDRLNLKHWEEKLDSIGALAKSEDEDDMSNAFRNYVITAMEFDYALGLMIEDLTKKGLMDNTTIVIFGDHNTYYQGLSNYVKDIYDYNATNYTNLYRTPLMIYDKDIEPQTISKFTTVFDIVPTILDMFGFKYYTNLYYGSSVFSDEESVIYSRAYNEFLTDKIYFTNLSNILYKHESVDEKYMQELEEKALIVLEKLDYINNIFAQDYFSNKDNYNRFISKMNEINNN